MSSGDVSSTQMYQKASESIKSIQKYLKVCKSLLSESLLSETYPKSNKKHLTEEFLFSIAELCSRDGRPNLSPLTVRFTQFVNNVHAQCRKLWFANTARPCTVQTVQIRRLWVLIVPIRKDALQWKFPMKSLHWSPIQNSPAIHPQFVGHFVMPFALDILENVSLKGHIPATNERWSTFRATFTLNFTSVSPWAHYYRLVTTSSNGQTQNHKPQEPRVQNPRPLGWHSNGRRRRLEFKQ